MGVLSRATRFFLAGAALAALEVGLVLASERQLFLSGRELARYAAFALGAWPLTCALCGLIGARLLAWPGADEGAAALASRVRRVTWLVGVPALSALGWLLTSGRVARELPGRAMWVLGSAVLASWLASRAVEALVRTASDARRARNAALVLGLATCGALIADMYLLRRLYPAFHLALASATLFGATAAAALWPMRRSAALGLGRGLASAALASCAWGSYALWSSPNARFAVTEVAPLSGKLVRALSRLRPSHGGLPGGGEVRAAAPSARVPPAPAAPAIDLRGRDVLLVTVDALRADRLAAYGGTQGLTPALDALAAQSAVFVHAYTPTPHTSYALTSLLTGKYMQPLLALGERGSEHPTLPELLRRHGYRTAAFYPPAIFFVDPERFAGFAQRHLGFEYVKAMFASVDEQADMLAAYLQQAPSDHPVFAWVHAFEPHEPYEPPPRFERGSSPRERYDGEVAAADEGVGRLVEVFRRARPGATVIVSADHGEEHGEHGGHHHGTTLFDEQMRVPWLWSSPGVVAPMRIEAAVDLVDLATTLLSALGVPREARMRGDDLTPLLAGAQPSAPMHAFTSIDGAQMVCDGRLKLACDAAQCRLFDLIVDPKEREDIADEREPDVARLRAVLAEMAASLPRVEALALDGGKGWPAALSRARMGDVTVTSELPALLDSPRAEVRAEAARALGAFRVAGARAALLRIAEGDPDPDVRVEAAIAGLQVGDDAQRDRVAQLAQPAGAPDRVRRAGLALAARGDARGAAVLLPAALDETLDEHVRIAALDALGALAVPGAAPPLVPLLADVRLRPRVASALGRLGDRSIVPALLEAFEEERYPEARSAEARALLALGARAKALAGLLRYLGMASSLPGGVALWLEAGSASWPSARSGVDLLRASSARRGPWRCDDLGCAPGEGAELGLPLVRSATRRVTLLAHAGAHGGQLEIAGTSHELTAGASEINFELAIAARFVAVRAGDGVRVRAVVAVPEVPELPPPPKLPWQASAATP